MSRRARLGTSGPDRERGIALLTVIMLMLVLGLLAAFLVESVSDRYARTSLARLTRQAEQAATGGLEWGKRRALQDGSCASGQVEIGGVTVDVVCAVVQVDEDGTLYPIYEITADARHGSYGNADHVRRTVRARYADR